MKKNMFSKFTSIIQHAVDALAPQVSLQEEFVHHWKAVTTYFMGNRGEKLPVEQTSIPAHLEQMLVLLQQEEMESERGMYGPCLEYVLQHKLLDTLYSLGRTDYPTGMKEIVLSFFTKLLSKIRQPLLAHVNVYRAVQRMIKTCGEVKAGPTEIEEIQFLCTVCAKVKADPYLVNFFLEMPKPSILGVPAERSDGLVVIEEPASDSKLGQHFHLVVTLLNLSHSEDSRVAVKACEGLMLCSSLPEPIAAHCLLNNTQFCSDLTQRLIDTFKKLPEFINPADLENVQAKWGLEVITEREDQQTFVGKRHLVSFLSWLDYCDQLSAIANPIIAEALGRKIREDFLMPFMQPALMQMSESGCVTAMAYMTRSLYTVCSERLLSEFVLFILGDERQFEEKDVVTDGLRARLIDRCNSVSEEMCLVSLQLFDTLLQKDDPHVLHNLVLRNLETRAYYNNNTSSQSASIDSPQSDADVCDKPESLSDSGLDVSNVSDNVAKLPAASHCQNEIGTQNEAGSQIEAESQNETGSQNEAESQNEAGSQNEAESQTEAGSQNEAESQNDAESQNEATSENEVKSQSEAEVLNETGSSEVEGDVSMITDSALISDFQCDTGDDVTPNSDTMQNENGEMIDDVENTSSSQLHNAIPEIAGVSPLRVENTPEQQRSPHLSPVYSKTEVHKIVTSFLSVLPEELKSSYQTADGGYDMYLKDAHRQYTALIDMCTHWDFPKDIACISHIDRHFYEGTFLHMLLDKLSRILDQSYPINLQLTSVISKLALVPHPCLHEYLLDPYLPLQPGVRNLYTIFQKVSNEVKSQFDAEPDLAIKLVKVRKKLMSEQSSSQSIRHSEQCTYDWLDAEGRLEAIIVLEEFCKELSAIAFVKHHAAVTQGRS